MKNRINLILLIALLTFPLITNAQHKSEKKKATCCEHCEKCSHAFNMESISKENVELSIAQVKEILNTYFIKDANPDGNTTYRPVMVSTQLDRNIITVDADGNQTTQIQVTQLDIPLITMAPINFIGISGVTTNEHGHQKLQLSEVPLPSGLTTIISAYSNSIQPIKISE